MSPELLARVADAPNLQVLELGGPTAQQLAGDPVFAQLPAFSGGTVTPVPALAYRPDYPAVLLALDALEQAFRR
ncbi:hypothetical protein [Pseudonocardia sp. NPDC049154]|uniref:hypothetical protein n=1 Tax=Pseudonocardia sp. NPDC049154 TaxID=3155501 RepID=UPI0033F72CCC